MSKLTPNSIIQEIKKLGFKRPYKYFKTDSYLEILDIEGVEGPIEINRWRKPNGETVKSSARISVNQIGTVAAVFSGKPNYPIHFDRLFSAGGNSRSAIETLMALTPNFFYCYPLKTNPYTGQNENKLKHLMWCPNKSHELGKFSEIEYEQIITEIELGVDYEDIGFSNADSESEFESIAARTTHTQMQVALIELGNAMNLNSWVAKNDQSITVGDQKMCDLPGVINDLTEVEILYNKEIKNNANLIDCIWFSRDNRFIPAVFEVEHSTGVTSGLTRMSKFFESIPSLRTDFVVVAPNLLRNKVVTEINQEVFAKIKASYLPYSTLRELYGLIKRYPLSGKLNQAFLNPFLQDVVGK